MRRYALYRVPVLVLNNFVSVLILVSGRCPTLAVHNDLIKSHTFQCLLSRLHDPGRGFNSNFFHTLNFWSRSRCSRTMLLRRPWFLKASLLSRLAFSCLTRGPSLRMLHPSPCCPRPDGGSTLFNVGVQGPDGCPETRTVYLYIRGLRSRETKPGSRC